MNTIKQQLLSGWHPMRWLRLTIGLVALVQALGSGDAMFGLIAGFLFFQVYTNSGCCGLSGCALPEQKFTKEEEKRGVDPWPNRKDQALRTESWNVAGLTSQGFWRATT